MKRWTSLSFVLLGALVARRAGACSMCRCGDATFNAIGPEVHRSGLRLAIDWERFDKESAAMPEETAFRRALSLAPRDAEVENRLTATVSYGFGEAVTAVARIPWSARSLTTTDGAVSASDRRNGLSDPELYALVRLWASPFAAGIGRATTVSLIGGVKTPWGENRLSDAGVRLDEHLQPGTGATDVFGGLWAVRILDPGSSLFASVQYRVPGANAFGYRYGAVALANAAYERKLTATLDGVVELNWRHAGRDRVDFSGARDPNTGGDVLYVTPRLLLALSEPVVARVAVQIPAWRSLYGDQTERAVVNVGLSVLF